jgi:hypothetical protein
MFIRFVIHHVDCDSGRRQGLFQALAELEHSGELLMHEQKEYERINMWFRRNLKRPHSFSRSSKPHAKNVAISWFKSEATEHIANMRVFAQILREHGIEVDELKSERPGYIVYEDQFQVAAEPFKDTGT